MKNKPNHDSTAESSQPAGGVFSARSYYDYIDTEAASLSFDEIKDIVGNNRGSNLKVNTGSRLLAAKVHQNPDLMKPSRAFLSENELSIMDQHLSYLHARDAKNTVPIIE